MSVQIVLTSLFLFWKISFLFKITLNYFLDEPKNVNLRL